MKYSDFPWTASSLSMFTTCPYKYYRQRVLKDVKDVMGEKAQWGVKVHKAFEDSVNYGIPLPEGCTQWQGLVDKIKAFPGEKLPEFRFAIDDAFRECSWNKAWSRGVADLVVRKGDQAVVFDYKTGKRKPSDQLSLYAGYTFAYWPEVKTVSTAFVWLQERKIDKAKYDRADVPKIWDTWIPIVRRVEIAHETDKWPQQPSGLCKGWCPVKSCPYHQERQ